MSKFKRFFSTDSAKAIKADKFGYLNGINYMAPHTTGGIGNLCPHSSQGCRDLCLGMYSGQAAMVKDLENGTNAMCAKAARPRRNGSCPIARRSWPKWRNTWAR